MKRIILLLALLLSGCAHDEGGCAGYIPDPLPGPTPTPYGSVVVP